MKAETSQIPGPERSTQPVKQVPAPAGNDTLWAQLRRLKAQMAIVELALSTARRDINRIDRKQYREEKELPPSEIPGDRQAEVTQQYHPALFG